MTSTGKGDIKASQFDATPPALQPRTRHKLVKLMGIDDHALGAQGSAPVAGCRAQGARCTPLTKCSAQQMLTTWPHEAQPCAIKKEIPERQHLRAGPEGELATQRPLRRALELLPCHALWLLETLSYLQSWGRAGGTTWQKALGEL